MSKHDTNKAQKELERQQRDGTHNPASQHDCGTWRTPGMPHTPNDTGPAPKGGPAHDG